MVRMLYGDLLMPACGLLRRLVMWRRVGNGHMQK